MAQWILSPPLSCEQLYINLSLVGHRFCPSVYVIAFIIGIRMYGWYHSRLLKVSRRSPVKINVFSTFPWTEWNWNPLFPAFYRIERTWDPLSSNLQDRTSILLDRMDLSSTFPSILLDRMDLLSTFPSILLDRIDLSATFPSILLDRIDLSSTFCWIEWT